MRHSISLLNPNKSAAEEKQELLKRAKAFLGAYARKQVKHAKTRMQSQEAIEAGEAWLYSAIQNALQNNQGLAV